MRKEERHMSTVLMSLTGLFPPAAMLCLVFFIMSSCVYEYPEEQDDAIKIGTMVVRSPEVSGEKKLRAGIMGWEAQRGDADYAKPYKWHTTIDVKYKEKYEVDENKYQFVDWLGVEPPKYNDDPSIFTYMKAWHPEGRLVGTEVKFDNDDATKDILLSVPVENNYMGYGNKECITLKKYPKLQFKHMTAAIGLKLKNVEYVDYDKIKLKKVELVNNDDTPVNVPSGLDLATNEIKTEPRTLTIYQNNDGELLSELINSQIGHNVMIVPKEGKKLKLILKMHSLITNKDFTYSKVIEYEGKGEIKIGNYCLISLSMNKEIQINVEFTDLEYQELEPVEVN